IILLALLYLGLSGRFRAWAERISRRRLLVSFYYMLFLGVFLFVVNLPFDFYRGFIVEHQYGFSNQTGGEWLVERLKMASVIFVFLFIGALILYAMINRLRQWWLWFSLVLIPLMVFVIIIFPVFITPIFNKFEPIRNQHLADEMASLATRAGIAHPDILQADASRQSEKLNAYFTGMFGTKRIVLYDNTIENMSVDELKFVMGHEIGHHVMNHLWIGLFAEIVVLLFGLYLFNRYIHRIIRRHSRRLRFSRLGDIASLPLVLLFATVFGFFAQPATNGLSRYLEYQADEYGFELSGISVDIAATTFDKFSVYNLSDPAPSKLIEYWFYDHPALNERIASIQRLYEELHPAD
ncbi:MAG: M48 family metallopeptidase, partial [Candidatus Zixiibacteriota bacterium]